MINPAVRPDASLPELLAARARGVSDGRLVLDVAAGFAVAVLATAFRPFGWLTLLGIGVCIAAFGCWGVLDREVREREDPSRLRVRHSLSVAITIARGAAAAIGVVAALVTIFSVLGILLGNWIS